MLRVLKYFASILLLVSIITLAGVYVWNSDKGLKAEEKAQKPNQTEVTSDQYKMYFSFDGDQTQLIDLIKGKANIKLIYSGNSKFTAKIMQTDGTLLTTLADVDGSYNQKQEIDVPETGVYLLDVKTKGEWSLSRE